MPPQETEKATTNFSKHQLTVMLVIVSTIALLLTTVAMSLYHSSGAIQLDLSRPGYSDARKEAAKEEDNFDGFSSRGPIDSSSLSEFESLYDELQEDAESIDAFSGDALSDRTLQLTTPETESQILPQL